MPSAHYGGREQKDSIPYEISSTSGEIQTRQENCDCWNSTVETMLRDELDFPSEEAEIEYLEER